MVDRIRMFNSDFKSKMNLKNMIKFRPDGAESGFVYYKLKSPRDKKENIYLTIKTGVKYGRTFLSVDGSLRKWMYGINGYQDLRQNDFDKTIESVGLLLCSDKEVLWGFKVSVLEIGFNVRLPMIFKGVVDCYASYSTFRRIWYEGETMCFEGESYSMIVYDKGEEIAKKRSYKKSRKDPEPIKKLNKQAIWLRYEFKTKNLSKVENMAKIANTPGKILANWNKVLDMVHEKVKDIKYIDHTFPNYTDEFVAKNRTELKNYLINIGMLSIGTAKTMAMVDKLKRNKDIVKRELETMNKTFVDKPRLDLERDLKRAISRRVRKLRKS